MKLSHYQNINGEPGEDPLRKDSAYWNTGKWKNYIAPLLPTENRKDMTFIDIGANNGLFCKMAEDAGFRTVIGIEADSEAVERGWAWKNTLKKNYNYSLLNKTVGKDFSFDELPLADIVLLSNVHYYFELKDWIDLLDELPRRTEYCLIITRPFEKLRDWQPLTTVDAVKYYFRDWELVKAKYKAREGYMEQKEDPKPRVLHALLFRSRLRRKRFDELKSGAVADDVKIDRSELVKMVSDEILFGDVENIEIENTDYYKAWKERMYPKKWDEKTLRDFVQAKIYFIENIIRSGIKKPILVSANNKTIDGKHRIAILEALGYESIMTRIV